MLDRYPDLERIATRIALRSVRPRELASLREALALLPAVAQHLLRAFVRQPALDAFIQNIRIDSEIAQLLQRAIDPEPALLIREGGVIATGYDSELDALRRLACDRSEEHTYELQALMHISLSDLCFT